MRLYRVCKRCLDVNKCVISVYYLLTFDSSSIKNVLGLSVYTLSVMSLITYSLTPAFFMLPKNLKLIIFENYMTFSVIFLFLINLVRKFKHPCIVGVYQITLNSVVFKRFLTTGVVGITRSPFFSAECIIADFIAGIIAGWLPIGTATRHGELVTDVKMMDSRYGRINYYISPVKLYN